MDKQFKSKNCSGGKGGHTQEELKDMCKSLGLKVSGTKADLCSRLDNFFKEDLTNKLEKLNIKEPEPKKQEPKKEKKELSCGEFVDQPDLEYEEYFVKIEKKDFCDNLVLNSMDILQEMAELLKVPFDLNKDKLTRKLEKKIDSLKLEKSLKRIVSKSFSYKCTGVRYVDVPKNLDQMGHFQLSELARHLGVKVVNDTKKLVQSVRESSEFFI